MKKLLLLLMIASTALGQVRSNQISKKTDGGLAGDASYALYVSIVRATSAPSTPLTGQLWCDTNTDPCILKIYDGSGWESTDTTSAIPVQTDVTSLPVSPVDGQLFFNKSNSNLYIYNSTASKWYGVQTALWQSGTSVTDVPTGTVITAPAGAMTATKNTSCGAGATTGTYSYKYTYANTTGGETTPSPVSNTITYAATTDCTGLTGMTVGGTGTTARRVYRSKAGAPGGPWYYVGTQSDNSTTTFTDANVTNANAVLYAPETNFSGAMPANWTVTNDTTATTSGGCGTTTSQTFRCKSSSVASNGTMTLTSDVIIRANRDLSSYVGGNFTVMARFLEAGSQEPPTYSGCTEATGRSPYGFFGMRYGTGANGPKLIYGWNNGSENTRCASTTGTGLPFGGVSRTTVGGAESAFNAADNGRPMVTWIKTANPLWVKVVKRGTNLTYWRSVDGNIWSAFQNCNGATFSDAACSHDISGSPTSWNQFEANVHMQNMSGGTTTSLNYVVEWDSFSITVD